MKEAILRDRTTFLNIFDRVIDLIYDKNSDVTEWAKKVDDLLKNQVYAALSKSYPHFDLEALISRISEKVQITKIPEVILVLIKWLEVLHSIQNVNLLPSVPKFLEKLLSNIESKDQSTNQKTEVSKKSIELLSMFIQEFDDPQSRNVYLDKKIINKLIKFLLKDKLPASA